MVQNRLTVDELISKISEGEGQNVEFKVSVPSKVRELTEEICSFANADGGFLLIGIDDNNNIIGADIDNSKMSSIVGSISEITPSLTCDIYSVIIDSKKVWIIQVPNSQDRPYVFSGNIFLRQGPNAQKLRTREEILNFFRECNSVYFDSLPSRNVDLINELDEDNFRLFCLNSGLTQSIGSRQILFNIHAFDFQTNWPKAGAILFFAKNPQFFYPQAWVHCVRFKGVENLTILDDKRFYGPLYQQYTQTLEWLKSKLEMRIVVDSDGPHSEKLEIPEPAIREALVNSLSHRDYYESGAVVLVSVYDDRIEISNPGELLSQLKNDFGTKSVTRNPFIFNMFTRMRLVEQVGSGIPRMRNSMLENNLPLPVFNTEGMFSITFYRSNNVGDVSNNVGDMSEICRRPVGDLSEISNLNLSSRQREILLLINTNPEISAVKIAQALSVSSRTIERDIATLRNKGVLVRKGDENSGYWEIVG